jgi:hypothetical protein
MGLLTKLKRDYQNAGAHISLSFHVVENLEHREKIGLPWFFCMCTGLELHNFANCARKDFLRILNETPRESVSHIKIPDAYWHLAIRALLPTYKSNRTEIPDQLYTLVRDSTSLVAESAFDSFEDGDALSVYLLQSGDVWVERLRSAALDLNRVRLGNVNELRQA